MDATWEILRSIFLLSKNLMAFPPPCGPFPVCGPVPLPGPCGPCGPCGPLYSGVGKCFPGPVGPACNAQELSIYPVEVPASVPTGSQLLYSNNTHGASTISSIVETTSGGLWNYAVNLNLAHAAGACRVTGTITAVYIGAGGIQNFTATTNIIPFATTAVLNFTGLPSSLNGYVAYIHLVYA